MRVAIVGGGIGGCALALSLHDAGIDDVEIFEASPDVRELGVGINVLPHAVRELTELGLLDELCQHAVLTGSLSYYNHLGQRIWTEPRGLAAGYRWPQLSIHRGRLLGILAGAVAERVGLEHVHHGQRIADVEALTNDFDVVVGADGIHSAVRAALVPEEGPPLWNGVTLWRGTTVMEPFLDGRTMVMAGRVWLRAVAYPVRTFADGRQLVNWIVETRKDTGQPMPRHDWNAAVPVAEPLEYFRTFRFDWLDVPSMIEGADEVLAYPMVDREPLARWRLRNVTLLGDAAHPMYPVGSNGASQAVLDARILARELATCVSVEDALDSYESIRRPATSAIVLANRGAGPEQGMELVAERAPDGFDRLDDVVSQHELVAISTRYKTLAGFDPTVLNERESWSVRR